MSDFPKRPPAWGPVTRDADGGYGTLSVECSSFEDEGRPSGLFLDITYVNEEQSTVGLSLEVGEVLWLAEQAIEAAKADARRWGEDAVNSARGRLADLRQQRDELDASIERLIGICSDANIPL
jgi:hypothetical protein